MMDTDRTTCDGMSYLAMTLARRPWWSAENLRGRC